MKAIINIYNFTKGPISNLHMLEVQVNLKLKQGLHINIVKIKMITQMAALIWLTVFTQSTSFQKVWTIYFTIVWLAILYGYSIWYLPPEWTKPREMNKTKLCQLDIMQNQCLCTIAGAYKLMPAAVLKHKTRFPLLQMYLEELAVVYVKKTKEGLAREHIERSAIPYGPQQPTNSSLK